MPELAYANVLRDLEARRAQLDVAIAALRAIGTPAEQLNQVLPERKASRAPKLRSPGKVKKAVPPTPTGRTGKLTGKEDAVRLRWVAGDSTAAIAKAFGVSGPAIAQLAKKSGWPTRTRQSTKTAPKARAEKKSLMRRCGECGQMTPANVATCQSCGEIA